MTPEPRRLRICGTGRALPRRAVDSDEVDVDLGLASGTIRRASGVRRRFRAVDETAADLAFAACTDALRDADLGWSDIDCVVAASATMDQALPFNAALVLARAGDAARPVAAFDVGASCMSFLVAVDLVGYAIHNARYRRVMVVSSDIATFSLDWRCLDASAIFGDGAAAVILARSEAEDASCLLGARTTTFPAGASLCAIEAGGSRYHPRRAPAGFEARTLFRMEGKKLFRLVARELPEFIDAFLRELQMTLSDFALIVPHQASRLALDHLAARLALDPARVVDIFADHGNQVGASLPSALHHALAHDRIARGESMLLIGSGAGVTLGAMALTY